MAIRATHIDTTRTKRVLQAIEQPVACCKPAYQENKLPCPIRSYKSRGVDTTHRYPSARNVILNHLDDRSHRWFEKFGHIGSIHNVIDSEKGSDVFDPSSPEEFQLARLDIQLRSSVSQPPKSDVLAFIWVNKSQFSRLVKLVGDVRNISCKLRVSKKICKPFLSAEFGTMKLNMPLRNSCAIRVTKIDP